MPIYIGGPEAHAIDLALSGTPTARPMTHDLFTTIIDGLGAEIRILHRAANEGTIQLAIENGANQFLGCARAQRQIDHGKRRGIRRENGRQTQGRRGLEGAQIERPLGRAVVGHVARGGIEQADDFLRIGQKPLPRRS